MYRRIAGPFCRFSCRRPGLTLLVLLLTCIPAAWQASRIRIDTNLKRLLPGHSPSVVWSQKLDAAVSDGGYFSVLFEGDDRARLEQAVRESADAIAALPGTRTVEWQNPLEFYDRHGYTLLDSRQLAKVRDRIFELQAELNPMLADLDEEEGKEADPQLEKNRKDVEAMVSRLANLQRFQTSSDGRVHGMIVRTGESIRNLEKLRRYYGEISAIAERSAQAHGIWWGVAGNLRNRVDEYDLLRRDLRTIGTFTAIAILLVMAISFRSLRILPVVFAPLVVGLLWSYALVPALVGDLNTITSFLLMVLLGIGVDYSVHLVKRFQFELLARPTEAALLETFLSTGRSVLTASMTTAVALSTLALSDFRGFSDFGRIGGVSLAILPISALTVLPAALVLGLRFGLVRARAYQAAGRRSLVPGRWVTAALALGVAGLATFALRAAFDYDFTSLSASAAVSSEARERHRRVYSGVSAPSAIYLAADLPALDAALEVIARTRDRRDGDAAIGSVRSLRDFAPLRPEMDRRLELIAEIKQELAGRWVERVKDPDLRSAIEDFRAFVPPPSPPTLAEIPAQLRRSLLARDDSERLVIALDTNGRARDGRMAMAFTRELYDLELPPGIEGPTGDKPVLAEILWLVTAEGGRIVGLAFVAVFLLVLSDFRALVPTLWVTLAIVSGMVVTLGMMVLVGWKLNFFNLVALPAVLGLSDDQGVHFYHRWVELGHDTRRVQQELLEPFTVCALATICGYGGMIFAHHPGLVAIGKLAVLGLTCCWFASTFVLPGMLRLREQRMRRGR